MTSAIADNLYERANRNICKRVLKRLISAYVLYTFSRWSEVRCYNAVCVCVQRSAGVRSGFSVLCKMDNGFFNLRRCE